VLARLTGDGKAVIWDVRAGRETATLPVGPATGAAVSLDGKTVATYQAWRGDPTVKLWDVATQRSAILRAEPPESNRLSVLHATFSPDGKLLAAGFQFQWVTVWDVATGRVKLQFIQKPAMMSVVALAFSPDNKALAVGTSVGTVTLWEVETGKRLAICQGHPSWVHALAFSPDGRTLATAGTDRTVRLWDVLTGQERGALIGHQAPVWTVAFSPDGSTLAASGADGTVKLWRAATDAVALARRAAPDSDDPYDVLAASYSLSARVLAMTDDPLERDPARAVELAKRATELVPRAGAYWQTLGVAHYRAGQWREAITALDKSEALLDKSEALAPGSSMNIQNGFFQASMGINGFFQAMAHWKLSQKEGARSWYDRAAKWTDQHRPHSPALHRLRLEAAALLGLPAPPVSPALPPGTVGLDNQVGDLLRQRAALDERAAVSPRFPWERGELARDYFRLAEAFRNLQRPLDAEAACRQALERFAQLEKEWHSSVQFHEEEGGACHLLASLLHHGGRTEEALPLSRKALEHFRAAAQDRPDRFSPCEAMAAAAADYSLFLRHLGKPEEAARAEGEALAARQAAEKLRKLPQAEELLARVRPFAGKRRWKQAAAELGKGFQGQPRSDPTLCYAAALANLLAGDVDGYASLIEGLPKRHLSNEWPHGLARIRTLNPRGGADPGSLVALAQAAYDWQVNSWSAQNLGMALYRAGKFDKALAHLEEATKSGAGYISWPALAMTHHQLGHADEARRWLDKTNGHYRHVVETSPEPQKVLKDVVWQDWAYFELLRREANALIDRESRRKED
jgi:tetratricopeptide (TPR) repeat protein